MSKFVFWFVLFWILSMIIALGVSAATLRGNRDSCTDLGNLILVAGEARDAGVTWDQIQTRVAEMVTAAMKNKESYIQTDQDAAFVIKSISRLWTNKAEPHYVTATRVFNQCMSKEA